MVPRIQFQLADQKHTVLFGNIVLVLTASHLLTLLTNTPIVSILDLP
jgi:hypothetical protein